MVDVSVIRIIFNLFGYVFLQHKQIIQQYEKIKDW
jgi:hypothetical protein